MITAIPEITNMTSYLSPWLQKPTSSNLWNTCLYLFMFLTPFMQVKIHESRTHKTDCLSVMWERREYSKRKMLINLARSSLLFVFWHLTYFYHRDTTDVLQKASSIFWRTWNSEGIGEKHSKWPAGLKDNRNICHPPNPGPTDLWCNLTLLQWDSDMAHTSRPQTDSLLSLNLCSF